MPGSVVAAVTMRLKAITYKAALMANSGHRSGVSSHSTLQDEAVGVQRWWWERRSAATYTRNNEADIMTKKKANTP